MYHENNVPKFEGWRPLNANEPMGWDDVLVYVGNSSHYYTAKTPEDGFKLSANKRFIGLSYKEAVNNAMNSEVYPYRKGKPQYVPHAIHGEPLPLP